MRRHRTRRADPGLAVVAVMGLIAVLFLAGVVMALAVSSSLHSVDVTSRQDAVHYAAESAVARGAGAMVRKQPCPDAGSINRLDFTVWCRNPNPAAEDEPPGGDIQRWAIPASHLTPGECVSVATQANADLSAWVVVAWQGGIDINAWADGQAQGCVPGGKPCSIRSVSANVRYVSCSIGKNRPAIHIGPTASPITLGGLIVRAVQSDADLIGTVVGIAGGEVDEADVSPDTGIMLWNTVLP